VAQWPVTQALYSLEYIGEVDDAASDGGEGLTFSLRHAPCAHICRYCLVSETRKGSKLSFGRFERLVHRFYDWRDSGETYVNIRTFIGPSLDYDIDTLKIDRLESQSCEEVFAEQERFCRSGYEQVPSLEELCARYGDPQGRKVYMLPRDLEDKWMDMHARETGIAVPAD
jgi:hypothetical protein